jgi:hypothetical protein
LRNCFLLEEKLSLPRREPSVSSLSHALFEHITLLQLQVGEGKQ